VGPIAKLVFNPPLGKEVFCALDVIIVVVVVVCCCCVNAANKQADSSNSCNM
jgi:hypothetical protein